LSDKEQNDKVIQEDLEFVARYIREKSSFGKFVTYDEFFIEPINANVEEFTEIFEKFNTLDEYKDISELEGKEKRYFYSKNTMTESYANLLFRIEEKDLLSMIAQTIRYNAKRFPKTTSINVFLKEPYNIKKEELSDILEQFKNNECFKDIKESKASNGVVCLFSEEYLTKDYADALTEYAEVTRLDNP
jgi:hypothetical protein